MNRTLLRASLVILSLLIHQQFIIAHSDKSVQFAQINALLEQYKRPFTVLELDARSGEYSLTIAQNFNACCVLTDEDSKDKLLESCVRQKFANSLMLLKKKLTVEELSRLAECEHFDVVLMMHGVEHYGQNWEPALNAALDLGDHTFIQVPVPNKFKETNDLQRTVYQYLKNKNGSVTEINASSISKPKIALFEFYKPKTFLKRKYWTFKRKANQDDFMIESSFEQKVFHKKKGNKKLPWLPGINLLTFKTLNGVLPIKQKIRDKLAEFRGIKHTDLHIWNVIIKGETLIPIDGDDSGLHYNPKFTLQYIISQFKRMLTRCGVLNDMDVEDAPLP